MEAEERERLGEETWRGFREGSQAECARVTDEIYRNIDYLEAKRPDGDTCHAAFEFLRERPGEVYFDPVSCPPAR